MDAENIHIEKGKSCEITMNNRASSGLTLLYNMDKEGIVSIDRNNTVRDASLMPGDPIKATFRIHAKESGSVKVTFFETQTWNKNFKNLILKEFAIYVD